mgnify:CR=1 FL=1
MKFRNRFYQFMQGRNGVDALARFVNRLSFAALFVAILFTFLSTLFLRREVNGAATVFRVLYYVFYGIGVGLFLYWGFRIFSKNVSQRQAENTRYLYRKQRFSRWFSSRKQQWRDRKTYRYFRCPQCKQRIRAPRGKGKIRVTCSKCKNVFITKT